MSERFKVVYIPCNTSDLLFLENNFQVPLDSDVFVSPRDDDYESSIEEQFLLQNLPITHLSKTTNAYRILSWHEVHS